jgi:hypothetical protein
MNTKSNPNVNMTQVQEGKVKVGHAKFVLKVIAGQNVVDCKVYGEKVLEGKQDNDEVFATFDQTGELSCIVWLEEV